MMWEWSVERMAAERPYWLAFSRLPALGTTRLQTLIACFGSLQAAWERATEAELHRCPEFGEVVVRQVLGLRGPVGVGIRGRHRAAADVFRGPQPDRERPVPGGGDRGGAGKERGADPGRFRPGPGAGGVGRPQLRQPLPGQGGEPVAEGRR